MKRTLLRVVLGIILLGAFQVYGYAGTFTAYGPRTFTRGSGKPVVETASFNIKNTDTAYTIKIYNGGINSEYSKVSSAIIKLNGLTIFDTNEFNQQASHLKKQVTVSSINQLQVELRSATGSGLTVIIEGEDNTPPEISITSPLNGAYLNNSAVTVRGTASDTLSWVNTVTVNGKTGQLSGETYSSKNQLTEGQNTITAVATDAAGNIGNSKISVILDTVPPKIILDPYPSQTNSPQQTITGKVEEASPVTALTINGLSATLTDNTFTATINLTEGINTITVTATDKAGNTADTSATITYTSKPAPVVSIKYPADGSTFEYSPVQIRGSIDDPAATVTINGNPATISSCTRPPGRETCTDAYVFSGNVNLTEGTNTITVTATNTAGKTSSASITIYVRDITPPVISVWSPQNGYLTTSDEQLVMLFVSDSFKFSNTPPAVTINDKAVTLTANQNNYGDTYYSASAHVPLTNGANTITVKATDAAGNSATSTVTVYLSGPSINITYPASPLSTVTAEKINITGTVDNSATSVIVSRSYTYPVTLSGNIFISSDIPLNEGANSISITASDAAGNTRTESITVYRDTTPPSISVTSPANGSSTNARTITVTGTTNDSAAQITVNGINAPVGNNTFSATGISLTEGTNSITVTAKDSIGNTKTTSITVYLDTTPPGVASTDPEFNGSNISIYSQIAVTFSEAMDEKTITSSTYTLNRNGTDISGSVTSSGNTAIFTPSQNLIPETIYTATIKGGIGGVKDAAGNPLPGDYIWQFKAGTGMELDISEPLDGAIINKANSIIRGTIKSYTNDFGITVNGIIAEINGGEWTAVVPLQIGQNTIEVKATDVVGETNSKTITINTEAIEQPMRISINPTSGIAPLNTSFTIDTGISNTGTSYKIDFDGDGVTDQETTDVSNISHIYDTLGIYYPTVTVVDNQYNTYTEMTMVNVLDKDQMDALLKKKWDGMKGALGSGDVTTALNYFSDDSKQLYSDLFAAIAGQLPQIAQDMQDIQLIYLKDNAAKYRIRKNELYGGQMLTVTHYIYFSKDINGFWKIDKF